jgi:hypothetical protein
VKFILKYLTFNSERAYRFSIVVEILMNYQSTVQVGVSRVVIMAGKFSLCKVHELNNGGVFWGLMVAIKILK